MKRRTRKEAEATGTCGGFAEMVQEARLFTVTVRWTGTNKTHGQEKIWGSYESVTIHLGTCPGSQRSDRDKETKGSTW